MPTVIPRDNSNGSAVLRGKITIASSPSTAQIRCLLLWNRDAPLRDQCEIDFVRSDGSTVVCDTLIGVSVHSSLGWCRSSAECSSLVTFMLCLPTLEGFR